MNGFDKTPNLITQGNFDFFNPKAGLNYTLNNTTYYTSIAVAHKEPNRDDYETGALQNQNKKFYTTGKQVFNKKIPNIAGA